MNKNFDSLLFAIDQNDKSAAKRTLTKDPGLALCTADKSHLYESEIYHWFYEGDTALHLAAAGYRLEIAKYLLNAGAEINAIHNSRHSSPLHYAADGYVIAPNWNEKLQVKMIKLLVDAGADIHVQDKNGATPLHRAVRTRCAGAVKCLLDNGADPKSKNNSGSTPFHLAVQNTGRGGSGDAIAKKEQERIIKEFILRGVSVKLKDDKGKTVLDCVKSDWIKELLIPNKI